MTDPIEYSFGGALIRSALSLPDLPPPRDTDPKAPVIRVLPDRLSYWFSLY